MSRKIHIFHYHIPIKPLRSFPLYYLFGLHDKVLQIQTQNMPYMHPAE